MFVSGLANGIAALLILWGVGFVVALIGAIVTIILAKPKSTVVTLGIAAVPFGCGCAPLLFVWGSVFLALL